MGIPSRFDFFLKHWKLGIHMIFRTRHFGVNNKWFSKRPSVYGLPLWKQVGNIVLIYPLWRNYQALKIRLGSSIGFIPSKDFENIFPKNF